jgi:hypothetical protein
MDLEVNHWRMGKMNSKLFIVFIPYQLPHRINHNNGEAIYLAT